jgi:hypothetical protein
MLARRWHLSSAANQRSEPQPNTALMRVRPDDGQRKLHSLETSSASQLVEKEDPAVLSFSRGVKHPAVINQLFTWPRRALVEFSKNWNPRNYGNLGLSAAQLKKIRIDLANLAKDTFTKVLRDGGYQVVTEAGDGVIEITPSIVNLYINAPDTKTAGRSKTYTMDAGSMTLALQVSDSVTGTLLAVAFDHKRDSDSGMLRWTSSASNRAAASLILTGWAEQLKSDLDAVRAK